MIPALEQHLLGALAELDRQVRRPWQRLRWSRVNPFDKRYASTVTQHNLREDTPIQQYPIANI